MVGLFHKTANNVYLKFMTKIGAKEIDGKMNNTEMKVVGFAEEKRKKKTEKRDPWRHKQWLTAASSTLGDFHI